MESLKYERREREKNEILEEMQMKILNRERNSCLLEKRPQASGTRFFSWKTRRKRGKKRTDVKQEGQHGRKKKKTPNNKNNKNNEKTNKQKQNKRRKENK